MDQQIVRNVVILGGGTAGWMTAAALSRSLNGKVAITVVESEQIATVGVGEATIPGILRFNDMLEIDENEFLRETQGTIKLGIEFVDWAHLGDRYMHGFGRFRSEIQLTSFEQLWQKLRFAGEADVLPAYSVTKAAAYANKFMRPRLDLPDSPLADIAYAFHFDAGLYARYLRKYSESRGVVRKEGKVVDVALDAQSSDIRTLMLESGEAITGEFFVDCSGFRARLIEEVYKAGYDDWTRWLPCDRAIAVASQPTEPLLPFTRATARKAGWQWRIPQQHRIGNGHVFCSKYMSEDEATAVLLQNLDGEPLATPYPLRFVTGIRRKSWHRNCVAIGLSSGFLEPLESTSISLIQSSIFRLLAFFPARTPSQDDIDEYNRLTRREFEHIRDFIALHYHATTRADSPLWNYTRTMEIPDSLRQKMDLFQTHGRLFTEANELFAQGSWVQVMQGQGYSPRSYNPIADAIETEHLAEYFEQVRIAIRDCVEFMPTHEDFIAANCKSSKEGVIAKRAKDAAAERLTQRTAER